MRKICYVTGTRADFGLMFRCLTEIHQHPDLELEIVATGMHFSEDHGFTFDEISASELHVSAQIPVALEPYTGAAMAKGMAVMLDHFVTAFEESEPDLVLLLGDRGEMLSAAIAAIHLNIHIGHIHGGERSGTVDEPVRHAVSKLSHYHFTANENASFRLIKMGEDEKNVFCIGAPGLDGIEKLACHTKEALLAETGFSDKNKIALFIYHPVLQDSEGAGETAFQTLQTLKKLGYQCVALLPNSDAGSLPIREALLQLKDESCIKVFEHLSRDVFISWMKHADLMIGNSSSGIIEAASFGLPVVNIGLRQNLRERNENVIDVSDDYRDIAAAIHSAHEIGKKQTKNIYGDGNASKRLCDKLLSLDLTKEVLMKTNEY